jgi:hypothetical protein
LKDWERPVGWQPYRGIVSLETLDIAAIPDDEYVEAELTVLTFWMQFSLEHFGIFPAYYLPSPDQRAFVCRLHL